MQKYLHSTSAQVTGRDATLRVAAALSIGLLGDAAVAQVNGPFQWLYWQSATSSQTVTWIHMNSLMSGYVAITDCP